MINLQNLLDEVKCYEAVRQWHWSDGGHGPHGGAAAITKPGRDTTQSARRKYHCQGSHRSFDELTGLLRTNPSRCYQGRWCW